MSRPEVSRVTGTLSWAPLYGGARQNELLAHQCGAKSAWHIFSDFTALERCLWLLTKKI